MGDGVQCIVIDDMENFVASGLVVEESSNEDAAAAEFLVNELQNNPLENQVY